MSEIDNLATDGAVYKTLLESTRAIPWKIDWATMRFAYIGPQIGDLLGWEPTSWMTVDDWATRIHEEDRQRVVDFCVAQSMAGIDHEADYRALTRGGDYVWIRDVVHVVRKDDGSVDSLIGFMFDISERKKTEEQLVLLQRELEEMSFKDGLTGVANRRRFDFIMDLEWGNARRNKQPMSLIMLDIDYFKQYNDHYGHLQGDSCLRQVASILSKTATRARDFLARFGGEEFVFILPETNAKSAMKIAERCRQMLAEAQIPHEESQVDQVLTASIGVSTIIPCHDDVMHAFIDTVDRRLYQAKQKGRDRIVAGD
jgi:diguanylate cyclase (GGDEF)-like protein/PAS domain S-box-containing protein